MKTISTLFLAFLFIFNLSLFSQEYEKNKIIVKIKQQYVNQLIFDNSNSLKLPILEQIIGNHNIETYLNSSTLISLLKKKNTQFFLNKRQDNGVERIYLVSYNKDIDPIIVSRKIQTMDFVEYAEPSFIRRISDFETPNDTLLYTQYYLNSISAIESWSNIDTTGKEVIIGVVDTGVDYLHEDLLGNMKINGGEYGLDESGNEKKSNGIDDDENGFIDDWMGWDFAATQSEDGMDNDPIPGNPHGTHVAGIIAATKNNIAGIAGIGLNTKILPVKIGQDNVNSRGLVRGYDGLLYAAIAGANVINCSWGGGGYSQAEQDVINEALSLGAVIVAAAGNDYSQAAFYPSAYDGVISVAAIDMQNKKADFSNYFYTVDVSAPGVDVMSTIPTDSYIAWSGTSMASPVAAAVAGMVWLNHPEYNNIQIGEHLKATTDDISSQNVNFSGLIGTGKVNALKAAKEKDLVSLILKNYKIIEEIEDGAVRSGEKIEINVSIFNALKETEEVKIFANSFSKFNPVFLVDELSAGNFNSLEVKNLDEKFSFIIPDSVPTNYSLPITFNIIDKFSNRFTYTITIFVNPSWYTMRQNNIHLTFTSQGNLAYDDFSNNNRGSGFTYKNSQNILFEGALMIAFGYNKISNVARGSSGSAANRDFIIVNPIQNFIPGNIAFEETLAEFKSRTDSTNALTAVKQTGYQFKGNGLDDVIFVSYDVVNLTDKFQDSVFTALYFDWDIGPSGSNNQTMWNSEKGFAVARNVVSETLPLVGVKLLSNQNVNFFAIDNDGNSTENPGVYDGFTYQEKWDMMSGKIKRDSSSVSDISMVIGAGPMRLRAGDTSRVSFAVFAADSYESLLKTADLLNQIDNVKINPDGNFSSKLKNSNISLIYPNPVSDNVTIEIYVDNFDNAELSLWDINGKKLKSLFNYDSSKDVKLFPGYLRLNYDLSELSQGQYFLRLKSDTGDNTQIINKLK